MKSWKELQTRLFYFIVCHTTPERFNDIVTIMEVIVYLTVIAMLSLISLCVIAA